MSLLFLVVYLIFLVHYFHLLLCIFLRCWHLEFVYKTPWLVLMLILYMYKLMVWFNPITEVEHSILPPPLTYLDASVILTYQTETYIIFRIFERFSSRLFVIMNLYLIILLDYKIQHTLHKMCLGYDNLYHSCNSVLNIGHLGFVHFNFVLTCGFNVFPGWNYNILTC